MRKVEEFYVLVWVFGWMEVLFIGGNWGEAYFVGGFRVRWEEINSLVLGYVDFEMYVDI